MATTYTTWTVIGAVSMAAATALPLRRLPTDRENARRYAILAGVTGIAAVAYALMSLDVGRVAVGGAVLAVPRYVDWLLTTPLLLLYLGLLAGADRRTLGALIALDVFLLVAGGAAVVVGGVLRWALFAAAVVAYLGIVAALAWRLPAEATFRSPGARSTFVKLRNLTVVLWTLYPIVWLLAPSGIGLLDVEMAAATIAYLDAVSKGVFVVVAVREIDAGDDDAAPDATGPEAAAPADD